MKPLIIILSFLFCTNLYGQLDKLKGVWITPAQELFQIEDTGDFKNDNYLSNSKLNDESFLLFIYGDTLSFQKRYYSSATNYKKLYIDRYDLKIISSNDTSIRLKPVSSFSKMFFQDNPVLTFTKQAFAIDTSVKFDKIIFHSTECYGTCPIYHLQIDKSKQLKLHAEVVYNPKNSFIADPSSQGYFIGNISDISFEKISKALQTCNIRTLKMNNALCCDGSIITIIVYLDTKRYYYKTMFPPRIADKLISTLYEICGERGLKKVTDKFEIED